MLTFILKQYAYKYKAACINPLKLFKFSIFKEYRAGFA